MMQRTGRPNADERRARRRDELLVYADPEVDSAVNEIDRMVGREPLTEAQKTDLLARDLGYLEDDDD